MTEYIFKSERLGFRNWKNSDLSIMLEINSDEGVMEFFPKTLSEKETEEFIRRMQSQYAEKGFCYFAVDKLADKEFIGFIGLSEQNFESEFTPCIDIGWRIKKSKWNKGYATEGAKACLDFAFNQLGVKKVNAIAPKANAKSELIMKKIGMEKVKDFKHPKLRNDKRLEDCVLYELVQTSIHTKE